MLNCMGKCWVESSKVKAQSDSQIYADKKQHEVRTKQSEELFWPQICTDDADIR